MFNELKSCFSCVLFFCFIQVSAAIPSFRWQPLKMNTVTIFAGEFQSCCWQMWLIKTNSTRAAAVANNLTATWATTPTHRLQTMTSLRLLPDKDGGHGPPNPDPPTDIPHENASAALKETKARPRRKISQAWRRMEEMGMALLVMGRKERELEEKTARGKEKKIATSLWQTFLGKFQRQSLHVPKPAMFRGRKARRYQSLPTS